MASHAGQTQLLDRRKSDAAHDDGTPEMTSRAISALFRGFLTQTECNPVYYYTVIFSPKKSDEIFNITMCILYDILLPCCVNSYILHGAYEYMANHAEHVQSNWFLSLSTLSKKFLVNQL